MITTAALDSLVTNSKDFSTVVEIYGADETPGATGFDPANALKRYANVGGLTFAGESYTRLVDKIQGIRRTITQELNKATVTLNNLTREPSTFETLVGFEGLILVIRLISRSDPTLANSIHLFTGRLEKPTSGTREQIQITARQTFGAVDVQIPRRKFGPDDQDGRAPEDPAFEGFRFIPQYGTTTYSQRVRRGGILGFFGFKKTVTKTLQYSSYSDLDAERYVPEVFGRAQVALTYAAYADIGTRIQAVCVACEGAIEDFTNIRSEDFRFQPVTSSIVKRYGYIGATGGQDRHPTINTWIGNGYYSRSAFLFLELAGTAVDTIDPAPNLAAIVLGKLVAVPNTGPTDWSSLDWTDDGAAITRHLLTSDDYFRLDASWLDDQSFFDVRSYNNEYVLDSSLSDVIFVPDTTNFTAEKLYRFYLSTGFASPNWFKYLAGSGKTSTDTFIQTPLASEYSVTIPRDNEPPTRGPGDTPIPYVRTFALRRRYTSNVVVNDAMKAVDFFYEVLFPSFRGFLKQTEYGKIALDQKKPADHSYASGAVAGTDIDVDDVSQFIAAADQWGHLLVDPYTTESEVRDIAGANYDLAQNAVTLTGNANVTITGFAGCDGAATPATASVEVTSIASAVVVTLDGVQIQFSPQVVLDTLETAAGFFFAAINAHSVLRRRFVASWTSGATFTITAKFGTLSVATALTETHVTGLADATTAPTVAAAAGGSLLDGRTYKVAYSYENARGETLMSSTTATTVSGANLSLNVTGVALPAGATYVRWYCSTNADRDDLRYHSRNDGSGFTIDEAPGLYEPLAPELNRTFTEVMRIAMAFTDRNEARTDLTSSNVLNGTFRWKIGSVQNSINRIDLKFRDSSQDFRLIELRLGDADHIAKVKKVLPLEVNGQAIDNYHQAYRVASSLLAEMRDHDDFEELEALRRALLLQEGDIIAITSDASQTVNKPMRIEALEYDDLEEFPKVRILARRYSTGLYDDSVAERNTPVIIEPAQGVSYV